MREPGKRTMTLPMANILYGVNGEGSGHSSRAREVITHLEAQGHQVHVASFDRGYRNLKDEFDVTEIDGLRLAYVENRVRYRCCGWRAKPSYRRLSVR